MTAQSENGWWRGGEANTWHANAPSYHPWRMFRYARCGYTNVRRIPGTVDAEVPEEGSHLCGACLRTLVPIVPTP
jgi:hypothetical protein